MTSYIQAVVVLLMTASYARHAQAIAAKDSLEEDVAFELQLGEQPWLALLEIPGGAFCSGTIVSPTSVLSAALCLKGVTNPTHGAAYAGNVKYREPKDFDPPTQNRSIVEYNLYDENNILIYNFMVAKIDDKWHWSTTVQPVGIIEEESLSEYFISSCYVSGLGAGSGSENDSKVARAASVRMGTWRSCALSPQHHRMCVNDSQMLSPHAGDLGGPVLCEFEPRNKLYGIISEHGKCGPEDLLEPYKIPAHCHGFQFIGFYAPWIKKTVGDLLSDEELNSIRQQHEHDFPHPLGVNGLFLYQVRDDAAEGAGDAAADGAATTTQAAASGARRAGGAALLLALLLAAARALC